jgi:fructose-specific phosphotransferase system IIC component
MTSRISKAGHLIAVGLLLSAGTASANATTRPDCAVSSAQSSTGGTNMRMMSSGPSGMAGTSAYDNKGLIPATIKLPMKLAGNGRI